MSWLQISINTTKDHAEQAENCLFAAGAQTVTLTDAADQPILEPGVNEVPIWNAVVITGLFSDDPCRDNQGSNEGSQKQLLEHIEASLRGIEHSCDVEVLEDRNWTRAWMDNYHAMQFGERLWVVPLHIDPPEPDAVNLRLDPGLAFGTGTHPTTSLCLRWLDKNIRQQKTLLDFGCGSGILAIAACMLGIENAHGVDIDPQALIATHHNAETNHVASRIRTWLTEDYDKDHADTKYDIVVANILSGPLTELSPRLANHTKAGGDIVLSGILKEQAETVLNAYNRFFEMDEPVFEEDWVMLHGIRI
jgi:ribosomal protein L11 methyltransferase